ncbi:EAL domain-containing protein [Clostridium sp. C2-6-12]|uniref:putative bifunctional diguanylate cyclase/phosphodiesterase n=1 Tax=Clostridium sp. C2-6-12 TaxID=2698832 RepID=UPI00136AE150|nr:EAL domain-containing protein [Clostridium sp. C2-6-12]
MKKLNIIGKEVINKIKEIFSIEKNMERNRLQSIFKKITILVVIIFSAFTIFIHGTLNYSYNNQNKIYEEGYMATIYANKINDDILNMRISSSKYSSSWNEALLESLKIYSKDIDENIQKYKMLNNLLYEEKALIEELISSDTEYNNKIKSVLEEINNSNTIGQQEIKEIISSEDKRIELSKKLVNYSSNRIDMLNKQNKKNEKIIMHTIFIINFFMIGFFILMIYVVKKINQRAEYYALYSSITGLPNKNHVINTISKDIKELYRDKFAILMSLDIDNFKAVNDTLGHDFGDKLLKEVGKRFKRVIHTKDHVYHMGGDEFLFLINSVYNKNQAEIVVKKIQGVFKEPFHIEGKDIDYVTASIGITVINQDGEDFETLYNNADDAMYEAKKIGKNKYVFYEEQMYSDVYDKILKKKAIEEGIKNGEFIAFYQPKVSKEEKFLGAEALVRWIKADVIIPPLDFIEFAEEEGLIKDIGECVIIDVCKNISKWIKDGYKNFRIAINLSAEQIIDESICENAIKIIQEYKVPFEYIEFEVTESTIIRDFDIAIKSIKKIKSYGIKVSLDDFGTGYSSLNYLKKLQVDSVKIDKSFIDTLVFDDGTNVMVNTIIKMCHYFGYEVVAEGVETREQIECLKDLNCDIFQGYYFGKPMKEEEFKDKFLA